MTVVTTCTAFGYGQAEGGHWKSDTLAVKLLAEHEQTAQDVAESFAEFVEDARESLDLAVYDMRISPAVARIVKDALAARARADVQIRIAYDADKPEVPNPADGVDPAEPGTGSFVQSLGYAWRRIGGRKLMHHKYVIRDAGHADAMVWTGSTNFTDDSWTLEENNILTLRSQQIADWYMRNFHELWSDDNFEGSGDFKTLSVGLEYENKPADVAVEFSPGRGEEIDDRIAEIVASARDRVVIWSMLLNSSSLLKALQSVLDADAVPVSGLYDWTQQASVLDQWQSVPQNHWKIPAIKDVVQRAGLVGKISTPYSPTTPHDFMHAKVLIVDQTVITGSYNFSRSAMQNAENILIIDSAPLADTYGDFVTHLTEKYRGESRPL